MTDGTPVWREFDQPRPLTSGERWALDALIESSGSEPLSALASSVAVSGDCLCGCSSIRLVSEGPQLDQVQMRGLGQNDRGDYAGIELEARDRSGTRVTVTLHILGGRLHELEFFAGEGIPTSWPLAWP